MKKVLVGLAILVISVVVGFVAYNLTRNVETVDQSSAPSSDEVSEALKSEDSQSEGAGLRSGNFIDADSIHSGTGEVKIVETTSGKALVFGEEFSVTSGPDLVVYLSKTQNIEQSGEVGEFVSLGKLHSTSGKQIYKLPENSDDFHSVVVWCRAFNTAFTYADLL